MEYKQVKSYAKAVNEDEGIVEAFVSVFGNVDLANEIVSLGAMSESIAKGNIKGLWMHDWNRPILTVEHIEEIPAGDPRLPVELKEHGGVFTRQRYYKDIEDSWQSFLKIKHKLVDEYSIGYEVLDYEIKDGVRVLTKMDLFEVSPVLIGANRKTQTVGVKSFESKAQETLVSVNDVLDWIQSKHDMRNKSGRTFSNSNYSTIMSFAETIIDAGKQLKGLLISASEKTSSDDELAIKKHRLQLRLKLLLGQ